MKKHFLSLMIILIGSSTILSSCKKGEEDPFLSLRSRDARITALWKLTSAESMSNFDGDLYTSSFNGSLMTNTSPWGSGSNAYSLSIEIKKDGTYQSIETSGSNMETTDGRWIWLNSAKNKTSISLDNLGTFEVRGLKSKELILYRYDKSVELSGSTTETNESSATWTFEKQ